MVGKGLYVAPDRSCTPGEWVSDPDISRAHVCSGSYNPRPGVDVSGPLKRKALAEYGLPVSMSSRVEADHYFPRWLGGATTLKNFWPELNFAHPEGYDNNPKDKLEFAVYKLVCQSRALTVQQARAVFAGDWRIAYCKYVR